MKHFRQTSQITKTMKINHALLTVLVTFLATGCSADNDLSANERSSGANPAPTISSMVEPSAERTVQSSTVISQTSVVADTVVLVQSEPQPPAEHNEDKWSPEAIQRDPYGFIQDQILDCDKLKAKIESQKISLTRLGKQSARTIEEADGTTKRYTDFLAVAKKAYKEAEEADKWPAIVNGFELDEEALADRIADALERLELAKKDREAAVVLGKKVEIRQRAIKAKARELASLRLKLVQQAEQVKTSAALAEIGDLSSVLGTLRDMTLEIEGDPSSASLDDLTAEDPDAAKKAAVRAFLDK